MSWAIEGRPPLPDSDVERAVEAALAFGERPEAELAVTFVGDDHLRELHERHLDDPSPTDVITFDLGGGPGPAGELYVSVECAQRVARRRGASLERELLLYVVHGVLHLCGYDDATESERARMRSAEREVLTRLGYAADLLPHDEGVD